MFFFLIRHGDPIYKPDSLTEQGHKQAAALAKRLARYGLDEIYCSTSIRAQMTAQPTCEALGQEMRLCPWAHEDLVYRDMSIEAEDGRKIWAFALQHIKEQFCCPDVLALGELWYTHPLFADTKFAQGEQRIDKETDDFFLSLGLHHDRENHYFEKVGETKERIALFAHQGFGLSFLSSVLDIPYPLLATHFNLSHSSMTVIHFDETKPKIFPRVLQMSNDSHLYREDLPTKYNNLYEF
jgi:probable phosphoglycerate mutase